ncbi:MAG: glycosyltransferase [Cyanobacteria bacterium J06555_13]
MRILSIHNEYQIRGGEDESCASEEQLLRDNGHEVVSFKEHNDRIKTLGKITLAANTIWSRTSYQTVDNLLKEQPFDIVHVQNFFPLISPSVYYAAQRRGVPVIQTLRNYRLLCPNGLFFRQGSVCEDCLGKVIPYPGIVHSCYREDRAASTMVTAMVSTHRAFKTWTQAVDRYISLTHFARNKFIEGGFPADNIVVKPNFVAPDPGPGDGLGGYALYVGRLSVEKGLNILLEAWPTLEKPMPLKIVGDGPLSEYVAQMCDRYSHIEWLGRRPMSEVHNLMGNAALLVFPSKWYETFGRVAVEAFAKGTPVVASRIGAIAELITHQQTGLLFNPGDAEDLAVQVNWLNSHPQQLITMRATVRSEYTDKYTPEINYQQLMDIYHSVTEQKHDAPKNSQ